VEELTTRRELAIADAATGTDCIVVADRGRACCCFCWAVIIASISWPKENVGVLDGVVERAAASAAAGAAAARRRLSSASACFTAANDGESRCDQGEYADISLLSSDE
jgi:hypothetical protein